MIENLISRKSSRAFKDEKISEKDLKTLIDVMNTSATSSNAHQSSVIVVTEMNTKKKIYEILGSNPTQTHIYKNSALFVFVADFNRTLISSKIHKISYKQNNLNDLLTAFGDAYIQATRLESAALELDFGTCYIGGIRNSAESILQIKKLLNISGKAIPILAITLGKEEIKNGLKPKLNRVYLEKYDVSVLEKEIKAYDKVLNNFWTKLNMSGDYSSSTIKTYSNEVNNETWKETIDKIWTKEII
ncbi:nitroreductase family protein [[Mycoplasma] mobile]|nr:nitroreductase family protein [[Mycoplasma] mobile]